MIVYQDLSTQKFERLFIADIDNVKSAGGINIMKK